MNYATTKAAKLAGISKSSVRLYCKEWSKYLSSSANPPFGKTRQFTDDDITVFRTIRALRDAKYSMEEIRTELEAGRYYEPIQDTEKVDRQVVSNDNVPSIALDFLLEQIANLKNERDYLRKKLESEREQRIKASEEVIQYRVERDVFKSQLDELAEYFDENQEKSHRWWWQRFGRESGE